MPCKRVPDVRVGTSKLPCQTQEAPQFALLFAYPQTQKTSHSAHNLSTASWFSAIQNINYHIPTHTLPAISPFYQSKTKYFTFLSTHFNSYSKITHLPLQPIHSPVNSPLHISTHKHHNIQLFINTYPLHSHLFIYQDYPFTKRTLSNLNQDLKNHPFTEIIILNYQHISTAFTLIHLLYI